MVTALLAAGANVNHTDYSGRTPLHEACERGHTAIVVALLGAGANANQAGYNGGTPLLAACQEGP